MHGSLLRYIVPIVIVIAIIAYKFVGKDNLKEECKEQVWQQMHNLPDFAASQPYYYDLLAHHHEDAFDHHFTMGGRRTVSKFDGNAYLDELFAAMIREAKGSKHDNEAKALEELRPNIEWEHEQ